MVLISASFCASKRSIKSKDLCLATWEHSYIRTIRIISLFWMEGTFIKFISSKVVFTSKAGKEDKSFPNLPVYSVPGKTFFIKKRNELVIVPVWIMNVFWNHFTMKINEELVLSARWPTFLLPCISVKLLTINACL